MRISFALLFVVAIWMPSEPQAPAQQQPDKKPRVDAFGDPLPEGAVARLGTVRWRPGLSVAPLVYSPDGKIIASGGGKSAGVTFWDATTGRRLHHVVKPRLSSSVAFSPDSKLVALTGDEFIRLYDLATAKEIRKVGGPVNSFFNSVAFSSDGKTVAAVGQDAANKSLIVLWDAIADKELFQLQVQLQGGPRNSETEVAFSPDGKLMATCGNDDAIRLWDVATGKLIRQFKEHVGGVNEIAFAPSGKVLASAAGNGVGRFWDVQTGKIVHEFKPVDGKVLSLAYSPDGKMLVTSGRWLHGGILRLWDTDSAKEIRQWTANNQGFRSVAFSPDGKVVLSAGVWTNAIRRWDPATGKEIDTTAGHTGVVNGPMLFSPDGKTLLTCGLDRRVVEWDIATSKEIRQIVSGPLTPQEHAWNHSPTGLSADGKLLALVTMGENPNYQIRIWDLAALREQVVLEGSTGTSYEITFSSDGKLLTAHGSDGVRIWDVPTGKQRFHLPDVGWGIFSPNGKRMAVAGMKDQTIRILDASTAKEVRRWNRPGEPGRLVFSSDGTLLASSGSYDDPVCLWAVDSGKELMRSGGQEHVSSLGFSPSGRILVGEVHGGKNRNSDGIAAFYLWDAWTGEEIRQIEIPKRWLSTQAFAPDGRLLASGGDDSTIMLWDMTGQLESSQSKPISLTEKDLADLWSDLISTASKADKAIWKLAFSPTASMPFLKERLQPAPPADEKLVAKLFASLESERFAERQKAFQDLDKLGESSEAAVRKNMEGKISLEARQRLQQFLDNRYKEVIRKLRAIETMEHICTAEARQLLQALAKDSPSPRVVEFATSTLARLTKRGN